MNRRRLVLQLNDTAFSGTSEDLNRLLVESDFVVVACPLTPETEGLVDSRALSLMKHDAVLVRNQSAIPQILDVTLHFLD